MAAPTKRIEKRDIKRQSAFVMGSGCGMVPCAAGNCVRGIVEESVPHMWPMRLYFWSIYKRRSRQMEKQSLIEQLKLKNPEIALYTVGDPAFSDYGQVLSFDTVSLEETASKLSTPDSGVL